MTDNCNALRAFLFFFFCWCFFKIRTCPFKIIEVQERKLLASKSEPWKKTGCNTHTNTCLVHASVLVGVVYTIRCKNGIIRLNSEYLLMNIVTTHPVFTHSQHYSHESRCQSKHTHARTRTHTDTHPSLQTIRLSVSTVRTQVYSLCVVQNLISLMFTGLSPITHS